MAAGREAFAHLSSVELEARTIASTVSVSVDGMDGVYQGNTFMKCATTALSKVDCRRGKTMKVSHVFVAVVRYPNWMQVEVIEL